LGGEKIRHSRKLNKNGRLGIIMKRLDVHLMKQSKRMCGPASLQMVLAYYGKIKNEKELKKKTGATYLNGTKPEEVAKVARKFKLKANYSKNNSIEGLREAIKKKNPPIIGWFSPDSGSHFSVVIGFEKNEIIIADPNMEKIRKMKIEDFSDRWLDINWSKFSFIKQLFLFIVMSIHNKISKFSNKRYKPPIKKGNLSFGEMILIKKK